VSYCSFFRRWTQTDSRRCWSFKVSADIRLRELDLSLASLRIDSWPPSSLQVVSTGTTSSCRRSSSWVVQQIRPVLKLKTLTHFSFQFSAFFSVVQVYFFTFDMLMKPLWNDISAKSWISSSFVRCAIYLSACYGQRFAARREISKLMIVCLLLQVSGSGFSRLRDSNYWLMIWTSALLPRLVGSLHRDHRFALEIRRHTHCWKERWSSDPCRREHEWVHPSSIYLRVPQCWSCIFLAVPAKLVGFASNRDASLRPFFAALLIFLLFCSAHPNDRLRFFRSVCAHL